MFPPTVSVLCRDAYEVQSAHLKKKEDKSERLRKHQIKTEGVGLLTNKERERGGGNM